MAKQSLDQVKGAVLPPKGMEDSAPMQPNPDWYQTRGLHSLSERCLQRMAGKELLNKFDSPVLNLNGDIKGYIWVETASTLYLFNALGESITEAIPLTDLVLWLEADSLELSNNDPVSIWNDQSSQGNDVIQPTSGQQPIYKSSILNGLPVVRFDGVNDSLVKDSSSDFFVANFTIFVVRTNNNGYCLSIAVPPSTDDEVFIHTTSLFHQSNPGNASGRTHQNSSPSGFFLQTARFAKSAADLQVWINGIVSTNSLDVFGSPNDYTDIGRSVYIGSRFEASTQYGNLDIAALLVYKTLLTNSQRAIVENYLMTKYAI